MQYVILLAILIFILYILYNPNKTTETFSDGNSMLVDKVYKKNMDLDYFDKRTPMDLSNLQKILSNQIAPIINQQRGKVEEPSAIVPALPEETTNRIPDHRSNSLHYNIPLPEFDDAQDHDYVENGELDDYALEDAVYDEVNIVAESEDEDINNAPKRTVLGNQCKFVSSFGILAKCPDDYPNETGAHLASKTPGLSCNGETVKVKGATAIAAIENGKVVNIQVQNKGKKYMKTPKVNIKGGGGKDAMAVAKIKDEKVASIELISGGSGYTSSPKVIIDKPNAKMFCNLCCK